MSKLVTLDQLKTRIDIDADDDTHDTLLGEILDGVTAAFEQHCERVLISDGNTVTEVYDGDVRELRLRYWPIVSITSIKESIDADWDNVDALTATDDYRTLDRRGIVRRMPDGMRWLAGWGSVQVVYTGGYTAAGEMLELGWSHAPDHLAEAALQQATYIWNRRSDPGATTVNLAAGGATAHSREVALLEGVKQLIAGEKR